MVALRRGMTRRYAGGTPDVLPPGIPPDIAAALSGGPARPPAAPLAAFPTAALPVRAPVVAPAVAPVAAPAGPPPGTPADIMAALPSRPAVPPPGWNTGSLAEQEKAAQAALVARQLAAPVVGAPAMAASAAAPLLGALPQYGGLPKLATLPGEPTPLGPAPMTGPAAGAWAAGGGPNRVTSTLSPEGIIPGPGRGIVRVGAGGTTLVEPPPPPATAPPAGGPNISVGYKEIGNKQVVPVILPPPAPATSGFKPGPTGGRSIVPVTPEDRAAAVATPPSMTQQTANLIAGNPDLTKQLQDRKAASDIYRNPDMQAYLIKHPDALHAAETDSNFAKIAGTPEFQYFVQAALDNHAKVTTEGAVHPADENGPAINKPITDPATAAAVSRTMTEHGVNSAQALAANDPGRFTSDEFVRVFSQVPSARVDKLFGPLLSHYITPQEKVTLQYFGKLNDRYNALVADSQRMEAEDAELVKNNKPAKNTQEIKKRQDDITKAQDAIDKASAIISGAYQRPYYMDPQIYGGG